MTPEDEHGHAVIGTGFIGGILGRALAASGPGVTFGSRHPEDDDVTAGASASVTSFAAALAAADVVILAIPRSSVAEFSAQQRGALTGKLVIDATNRVGAPVATPGPTSLPRSATPGR